MCMLNPIPTGHGRNQLIYERHVTTAGGNRVKTTKIYKLSSNLIFAVPFCFPRNIHIVSPLELISLTKSFHFFFSFSLRNFD